MPGCVYSRVGLDIGGGHACHRGSGSLRQGSLAFRSGVAFVLSRERAGLFLCTSVPQARCFDADIQLSSLSCVLSSSHWLVCGHFCYRVFT